MQGPLLIFRNDLTMTVTEKRFNRLEERVNEVFQRLAVLEVKPSENASKTPWWLPIVAAVATIVGSILVATNHIDSELSSMRSDLSGLTTRTVKNEGAIKALSDKQDKATQNLIHDLLASAESAGPNASNLPRILSTAKSLVVALQSERHPASADYFQDGINLLDQINQSHGYVPAAFDTRIALASYRTSIELPGSWGTTLKGVKIHHMLTFTGRDDSVSGVRFDATEVDGSVIEIGDNRVLSRNIKFEGDRFDGGTQILDGIHWKNVYFVGTHIRYLGGQVELDNVRFSNCTFEVPASIAPKSKRAKQVIDYAALAQQSLTFSGE